MFREVGNHFRPDAGAGGRVRAGDLALPINAEQLRPGPGDAQHIGLAPGVDSVVAIGETAAQRRADHLLAVQPRDVSEHGLEFVFHLLFFSSFSIQAIVRGNERTVSRAAAATPENDTLLKCLQFRVCLSEDVMYRLWLTWLALLFLSGCGSSARPTRIGFMPKLTGIPYFNACKRGAEEAARELKVELVYNGPTQDEATRQVEMLNGWLTGGEVDAICVACTDPNVLAPVLRDCRAGKVPVITCDERSTSLKFCWSNLARVFFRIGSRSSNSRCPFVSEVARAATSLMSAARATTTGAYSRIPEGPRPRVYWLLLGRRCSGRTETSPGSSR